MGGGNSKPERSRSDRRDRDRDRDRRDRDRDRRDYRDEDGSIPAGDYSKTTIKLSLQARYVCKIVLYFYSLGFAPMHVCTILVSQLDQ